MMNDDEYQVGKCDGAYHIAPFDLMDLQAMLFSKVTFRPLKRSHRAFLVVSRVRGWTYSTFLAIISILPKQALRACFTKQINLRLKS